MYGSIPKPFAVVMSIVLLLVASEETLIYSG